MALYEVMEVFRVFRAAGAALRFGGVQRWVPVDDTIPKFEAESKLVGRILKKVEIL